MSTSTPPTIGDIIESYVLIESIGVGGNAMVFRAESRIYGDVALKFLLPGKTTFEDVKRFEREFYAMKALTHENIITVYEMGKHNGYPWISMQLAEGGDLSILIEEWNTNENPHKYQEIEQIFLQICQALEHIHAHGMIHRDLKPSNILLTKENVPKITDFGGVKAPKTFKSEITTVGALVGTVAFMAPEQILGDPIDERADLYSLGTVLYMCLTGQKIFQANNLSGYLAKHLSEKPKHPQELSPEIPTLIANICYKLVQKDPDDRYANARDIIVELSKPPNPHLLIGRKTQEMEIQSCLHDFLQGESLILCLYGPKAIGHKALLHGIIAKLQENNIPISTNFSLPSLENRSFAFVIQNPITDNDFIEQLQARLLEGHRVMLVINSRKLILDIENHFNLPCYSIHIPPITLHELQQYLQVLHIIGDKNIQLAQRLQQLFKGRIEYIQKLFQDMTFVQTIRKTKLEDIENMEIHIPANCVEYHQQFMAEFSLGVRQIIDCLVVYGEAISLNFLKILVPNANNDASLMENLHFLEKKKVIQKKEAYDDIMIELSEDILEKVLLAILSRETKVSWHQRIAASILQRRRLREHEKCYILYHLEQSKQYTKAIDIVLDLLETYMENNPQELIKRSAQSIRWLQSIKDTPSAQQPEPTKILRLYEIAEHVAKTQKNFDMAMQYTILQVSFLQKKSTEYTELCLRQIQYHSDIPSKDQLEALHTIPHTHTKWMPLHLLVGQRFLSIGDFNASSKYWGSIAHFYPDDIDGQLAKHLVTSLQERNFQFLDYAFAHPEHIPTSWYFWILEILMVQGNWHRAQQMLKQYDPSDLGLSPIEKDMFQAWIFAVQGKLEYSKEIIQSIQIPLISLTTVRNIQIYMHLMRIEYYTQTPQAMSRVLWSQIPANIEEVKKQWSSLQNRQIKIRPSKMPELPLCWLQDICLLDISHCVAVQYNFTYAKEIWQSISSDAWGIKKQILSIFMQVAEDDYWTQQHNIVEEHCRENGLTQYHTHL